MYGVVFSQRHVTIHHINKMCFLVFSLSYMTEQGVRSFTVNILKLNTRRLFGVKLRAVLLVKMLKIPKLLWVRFCQMCCYYD